MTTSEELRERALTLAQAGASTDQAVAELLALSADHRVPLVRARQALADQAAATPQGEVVAGARRVTSPVATQPGEVTSLYGPHLRQVTSPRTHNPHPADDDHPPATCRRGSHPL